MKIPFALLENMVKAGASARMVVDVLKEKAGEAEGAKTAAAFLQFRAAYPKRDGSNPWRPAEQIFYRLVKAGVDPASIVAAAVAFKEEQTRFGKVGTEYIPMAKTWLNQHRFADVNHVEVAVTGPDWDAIAKSYSMFHHWSRFAGPAPDMPNCRCPREILDKYGIAP